MVTVCYSVDSQIQNCILNLFAHAPVADAGGVLLDSKGRLIGINTAILDPTGVGSSSGVGFAIPIDGAKGLVEQILKYGRVMRPYLGVTLAPASVSKSVGVEGVLVLDVSAGGPAARAGLQPTKR